MRCAPRSPAFCAPRVESGYTIFELLVVLALLALMAGAILSTLTGADDHAHKQINEIALGEVKKAVQRFRNDMGMAPRHMAELLQSPARPIGHSEYDPKHRPDGMGGWWWRSGDGYPEKRLWSFEPSTARGWDGPYLSRAAFRSAINGDGFECESSYIRENGTLETVRSNGSTNPPRRMALVLATGQSGTTPPIINDFRFDHRVPTNVRLHMLGVESRPRLKPVTVDLEIRP